MTPNKPSDSSTWAYDEGEEMCKDISYLQEKTLTKDVMKEMMMDSQRKNKAELEVMMDTKMDGLKVDIMEGLKGLLRERHPESDNISHEIHDEDTGKVNHEWRNFGFGLRTNHIPKIDMRNFDGKDHVTWILQMEQFFDLHQVTSLQKVIIASLYLEPEKFVWYRFLCNRKKNLVVSWSIFMEELITHYEDPKSDNFFSQLINLNQRGLVHEHIQNFQRLSLKV